MNDMITVLHHITSLVIKNSDIHDRLLCGTHFLRQKSSLRDTESVYHFLLQGPKCDTKGEYYFLLQRLNLSDLKMHIISSSEYWW